MFQLLVWGFAFGFDGFFGWSFMGKKKKRQKQKQSGKRDTYEQDYKNRGSIDMNDYD